MWISPSYKDTDFQQPLSIDDKITIFEDRVLGWKLNIADQVINGIKQTDGTEDKPGIAHSGYATLDIVFSYFEMIGKYEAGFTKNRDPETYFNEGIYSVFPDLKKARIPANIPGITGEVKSMADFFINIMYKGIRCGLYHIGATNTRVILTGEIPQPFAIDLQNMRLIVNPHLLPPVLKAHFANYIARLRDPNNQDLRQKFEARFDFDTRV